MTERFHVRILPPAQKALSKLHPTSQRRIAQAIELLKVNPHPPRSKSIIGPRELFRVRVGDYRIVYAVRESELVIIVVALGHRKDVYRRLPT